MSGTIGIEFVQDYNGLNTDLPWTWLRCWAFYQGLAGVRKFAYGNDWAWDQDFEQSGVGTPSTGTDSTYVDSVDIFYFSGHGSPLGLQFGVSDRDNGWAQHTEMRLGNKELK